MIRIRPLIHVPSSEVASPPRRATGFLTHQMPSSREAPAIAACVLALCLRVHQREIVCHALPTILPHGFCHAAAEYAGARSGETAWRIEQGSCRLLVLGSAHEVHSPCPCLCAGRTVARSFGHQADGKSAAVPTFDDFTAGVRLHFRRRPASFPGGIVTAARAGNACGHGGRGAARNKSAPPAITQPSRIPMAAHWPVHLRYALATALPTVISVRFANAVRQICHAYIAVHGEAGDPVNSERTSAVVRGYSRSFRNVVLIQRNAIG